MKQDNSGVSKSKYVAARNKFKSLVRQKKTPLSKCAERETRKM